MGVNAQVEPGWVAQGGQTRATVADATVQRPSSNTEQQKASDSVTFS